MSYEPTNWQTGDVVSSERLNKIEKGISTGTCMLIEATPIGPSNDFEDAYTWQLSKTAGEIIEAANAGTTIVCKINNYLYSHNGVEFHVNMYSVLDSYQKDIDSSNRSTYSFLLNPGGKYGRNFWVRGEQGLSGYPAADL